MLIGVLEFTVSFLTGHNFQRIFVGLYIELLLIWNVQKWKYFESSKNLRTRLEVRLSRANKESRLTVESRILELIIREIRIDQNLQRSINNEFKFE